jgi:hypothetical protein
MRIITSLIALSLVGACTQSTKTPVDDDFSSLSNQDEKSDSFSNRMKIVGSLEYGQASANVRYTKSPRYRAFKFGGNAGDAVEIWVRSKHGDAVAWLLDNNFDVIASNDDADDATLDAHVTATLPASASITHYIVFRDYALESHDFSVELAGVAGWASCTVDADCVSVPTGGCCIDGSLTAVNANAIDAYDASVACTVVPRPLCPQHIVLDTRVAQCNTATNRCEMIAPEQIHCGGNIRNAHTCPDGFACQLVISRPDTGGSCVATTP